MTLDIHEPLRLVGNAEIEAAEAKLLELPQVDCPLTHRFAPGVYLREITMPAGSLIIGHEHKTKHFNIVLTGRALVMVNGEPFQVEAPHTFVSEPGVRKVIYVIEEMKWITIHPNEETDIDRLTELLIVKSPSFVHYHEDVKRLKSIIETP